MYLLLKVLASAGRLAQGESEEWWNNFGSRARVRLTRGVVNRAPQHSETGEGATIPGECRLLLLVPQRAKRLGRGRLEA